MCDDLPKMGRRAQTEFSGVVDGVTRVTYVCTESPPGRRPLIKRKGK
jgi:hypothetical protein